MLDKLRLEVETLRADQHKLRRGMRLVESELDELNRQVQEARAIDENFQTAQGELRDLEREVKAIEESQKTLESQMSIHIKDMDDAALRSELERLRVRLRSIYGETIERAKAIDELHAKQEGKSEELLRRQTKRGALEQNELLHRKDLNLLEAMKKSFHDHNFLRSVIAEEGSTSDSRMETSNNAPTQSSSLEEWSVALTQLLRDMDRSVTRIKKTKESILKKEMESVTNADVIVKTAESSISAKKETRKQQGKDLQEIRLQIQGMGDAQSRFKEAKEREAVAREIYEKKRTSMTIADLQKEKEKCINEQAAAQKELDRVRNIRDGLLKDQELRTELEVCKESVVRTERELGTGLELLLDKLVLALCEVQDAEKLVPNYAASENRVIVENLRSADFGNPQTRGQHQEELIEACRSASLRKDALTSQLDRRLADLKSKLNSARAREGFLKIQAEDAQAKIRSRELILGAVRKELLNVPRVDESPDVEDLSALFQKALVVSDESGCGISAEQIEQVDRTVKSVDHEVVAAQERSSLSFAYARFAQDDLDKFESSPKHLCPTCGLSSTKKVDSMRKRMQEKVNRYKNPNDQAKEKDIITKLQRTSVVLKKVRNEGSALVSIVDTYIPTKKDLEEAAVVAQDCEQSTRELTELMRRVQELLGGDSAIGELEERRSDVVRLAGTLERNIRDFTAAKDNLPPSSHREHSLTEMNAQVEAFEQRITRFVEDFGKISKSIDRERESLDHANRRLHNAIGITAKLQERATECAKKEQEKERLITTNRALDGEIEALQDSLPELIASHNDAGLAYSTVAAEQDRLEDNATRMFNDAKEKVSKWKDLMQKVNAYSSSTTKNQLAILMKSIAEMEEDIRVLKQDIAALHQESQTSSNSDHGIRLSIANIESNMGYRANEQKLRITKRSMRHLQDDINRLRAQVDGGDPKANVKAVEAKINECSTTYGATQGKFHQITEHYKVKWEQFTAAEKDGSRRLYDECRIQKQTIELASTDLDRYHRALDQALMAFHTLKMNSINRIIKELWQQTYRGTDIDEIEITSDAGDALGGGGSTGARRNYNYRVMMRQGQAQLDMRGRCSAGQKVLACLVIRLALAESFCTDCGILALDEPTTNLDHENIESLAFALKSIIEHRRKQRNFQLVLITHDREFIEMIGARDFANDFFMVYKDSDGISHAKVQDLNQLPE